MDRIARVSVHHLESDMNPVEDLIRRAFYIRGRLS